MSRGRVQGGQGGRSPPVSPVRGLVCAKSPDAAPDRRCAGKTRLFGTKRRCHPLFLVLLRPKGLGNLGTLGNLGRWELGSVIISYKKALCCVRQESAWGAGAKGAAGLFSRFSSQKCYYLQIAPAWTLALPLVLGAALRADTREGLEAEAVELAFLSFLGIGASSSPSAARGVRSTASS